MGEVLFSCLGGESRRTASLFVIPSLSKCQIFHAAKCHEELRCESSLATGVVPRSADTEALRLRGRSPAHPTPQPPYRRGIPPLDSRFPRVSQRHAPARNGRDGRQPFPDALGSRRKRGCVHAEPSSGGGAVRLRPLAGTAAGPRRGSRAGPKAEATAGRVDPRRGRGNSGPTGRRFAPGPHAAVWVGHEASRRPRPARQGSRLRPWRNHRPAGQRPKGLRHHVAGHRMPTASGPPGTRARAGRSQFEKRVGAGAPARRLGPKAPECQPRVGLAMGVSRFVRLRCKQELARNTS